jgi:hypothetical protein
VYVTAAAGGAPPGFGLGWFSSVSGDLCRFPRVPVRFGRPLGGSASLGRPAGPAGSWGRRAARGAALLPRVSLVPLVCVLALGGVRAVVAAHARPRCIAVVCCGGAVVYFLNYMVFLLDIVVIMWYTCDMGISPNLKGFRQCLQFVRLSVFFEKVWGPSANLFGIIIAMAHVACIGPSGGFRVRNFGIYSVIFACMSFQVIAMMWSLHFPSHQSL